MIKDYDKENDILSINFGGKVEYSIELFEGNLVLDFNDEDEVVGFEIFDFEKEIKKFLKKLK